MNKVIKRRSASFRSFGSASAIFLLGVFCVQPATAALLNVSGVPVLDRAGTADSGLTWGASGTLAKQENYSNPMSWGVNGVYTLGNPGVTTTNPGPVSSGANATYTPAAIFSTATNKSTSWFYANTGYGGAGGYLGCAITGILQNCDAGTLTITFSGPVTNPVLHIQDIGGSGNSNSVSHSKYTLASSGSLMRLSGTPKFQVSGNTIQTAYSPANEPPVGSGSVMVIGTFTSISFTVLAVQEATLGNSATNDLQPWEGVSLVISLGDPSIGAATVPTLSDWAMILMASLMAMFGYARLRRERDR